MALLLLLLLVLWEGTKAILEVVVVVVVAVAVVLVAPNRIGCTSRSRNSRSGRMKKIRNSRRTVDGGSVVVGVDFLCMMMMMMMIRWILILWCPTSLHYMQLESSRERSRIGKWRKY